MQAAPGPAEQADEPRTQLAQEAYLFTLTNEPSRAPKRHVLSKREAGGRRLIVMQACKAKGDAHSAQQQTIRVHAIARIHWD